MNGLSEGCYIRPIVFLGYGEMGLNPLHEPCSGGDRGLPVGHVPG